MNIDNNFSIVNLTAEEINEIVSLPPSPSIASSKSKSKRLWSKIKLFLNKIQKK